MKTIQRDNLRYSKIRN